jgi:hypothetical protein
MTPHRVRVHPSVWMAFVCAAIAIAIGLFAADVNAWRSTVARDDVRFRALPAHQKLWNPKTLLPGDPASLVMGTGSTISYRRALQSFWYSRIGTNPEVRQDMPTLRGIAQTKLQSLISSAPNAVERSTAANLLGVLVVTSPSNGSDPTAVSQILVHAAQYFQEAISLNPGNTDAKENLEIVLRLRRPGKGRLGQDARSGYGFGKGNGIVTRGSGY